MHEGADGAGGDSSGGSQSMLVAKPAPDFQLNLTGGEKFKLSEEKGTVIILDFWASWCGPCMQAMPQTDKVVEEFKDRKVKLIAVNMQEDKATIASALERLKINPSVAMDIDGAIAERYQVTAIPQVVVIDAQSNVVDVMIGAGPNYAAQLTKSIEKALTPAAPDKQP
jgi:thiol-disulfide isomerase/thioredoxin